MRVLGPDRPADRPQSDDWRRHRCHPVAERPGGGGPLSARGRSRTTRSFSSICQTKVRLTSADEFARVFIRTNPDGSILRLGDVARIELGAANLDRETRLNGKPATLVGLYQALGTNAGRPGPA